MNFKDFENNPQDLVGKLVLHSSGMSYNTSLSRAIRKIERVTKTGFAISNTPNVLFSLESGRQKGLNGRSDMATVSKCELITEEHANEYRMEWKRKREEKVLRDELKSKADTLTLEQLQKIKEII